jgi:CHASE2 domain-containing sensor protein
MRLLIGVVYLVSISGLIVWEFRDHMDTLTAACHTTDSDPKPTLFSLPYNWLLHWTSAESSDQVSVVAIPNDLDAVQKNICLGRSYLSDLVRSIAAQHPAEIVVDKFFGPTTCTAFPETTTELLSVVQSLHIPVVVGESTSQVTEAKDDACLVRKPQLDFDTPYLHHGLTRLNFDPEKVPLHWRVLSTAGDTKAQTADSLSLAAVKAYDPSYIQRPRIQALVNTAWDPYANLNFELPHQTSTQLLCDAGSSDMQKRWSTDCSGPNPHNNLAGKIVVIGSEDLFDRRPVLNANMWGFDLQARYIQVLLSGRYLRALPFTIGFSAFALFIFVIEGVPTLLESFRPHWRKHPLLSRAFKQRRYVWVIFWTVAFLLIVTAISLFFGYLPPLVVFGDILLVVLTRLLFFAAESTATPLLHSK